MNASIEWFTKNPVAANLLMILILAGGGFALMNSKQEVIPELSLDTIAITVNYLGAAPNEVEEGVCVRIEEAVSGLDGIRKITSTAAEGFGTVSIIARPGTDMDQLTNDVRNRVNAIDTFPAETEKPIIRELTNKIQVIDLVVSGDTDEKSLKSIADRIRDEVIRLDGITNAEIQNARPREIAIEVSEDALRRHGLSFDTVAEAVRGASLDLPGGSVKTRGGEILLRTKGQAYDSQEFAALPLLTRADGTRIALGDVAHIVDGFAETDQSSSFAGKPCVVIEIFRVGDQNALDIADTVYSFLPEARASLPDGISLDVWLDQTVVLEGRLSLLARNGIQGLLLVFLLLALFLKLRLAMWVSLGIPVAFLGTFWIMPAYDVSINLISLFAFIVVLGIVVDDAIVVGESIFTHQQRTGNGLKGAIEGAREVAIPVTFGVLTTITAFLPMLGVEGSVGRFFRQIPIVVIGCLVFSFIESKWILPRHLVHIQPKRTNPNLWQRFQERFAQLLDAFVGRVYRPTLDKALRWRYLTLASGMTIFLLTLGLIAGGFVRFNYMDNVESDYISASVVMPQGTPVEKTQEALAQIEEGARQLAAELAQDGHGNVIRRRYATVGSQPFKDFQDYNAGVYNQNMSSGNLAEMTMELIPAENRTSVSSERLAERWRELTGEIPESLDTGFTASLFSAGKDLDVQLVGKDLTQLNLVAEQLKAKLFEINGVNQVTDNSLPGKRELQLALKPEAEVWGVTLADLGRQVRQAFYGEEAQRVQRGRDDVRVMVRYPAEQRRSLADLENMRIRTASGLEVPFGEVAEVSEGRGFATVRRVDRQRAVNVTASLDKQITSAGEVIALLDKNVMPDLLTANTGVSFSYEGQSAEQRDTVSTLFRGFALAMLLIYALLAVPLRSYWQPLLIMSAIPFGLIGAVWGHIALGFNLTMLSFLGVVALAGVVINDSLVMVDFINRRVREGTELHAAIRDAGVVRFRPILLTSLTTFAGLMPMMMEQSVQAKFLIPMAVSLAFGVLFATFISLLMVPAGYWVMADMGELWQRLKGRQNDSTPATSNQLVTATSN